MKIHPIRLTLTLILALALIAPLGTASTASASASTPPGGGVPAPGARPAAPISSSLLLAGPDPSCDYDRSVDALLHETSQAQWSTWVRRLSGDLSIEVGGRTARITTRYSPNLFNGASPAYDYVREQVENWYAADQISEDPFSPGQGVIWKNLILEIPGSQYPDEVVMLVAHLDSTSNYRPTEAAPGADDNATGAAALLEAARLLQDTSLARTLRLVWFTGEEQGMVGSYAYTADHDLSNVVGVINVDMVGYDGDGDRCFELHVGTLPSSARVGRCFTNAVAAYDSGLAYDFITEGASARSDHAPFWNRGIGAVHFLENTFPNDLPGGCRGYDFSPNYHSAGDTFANLHPEYGYRVSRAALATAFSLAGPADIPNPPPLGNLLYLPMLKSD